MNSVDKVCSAFLRSILIRMKELGLNQTSLARRMNVSRAYVSKVLRGEDANFTFASALRFAHALEMDFFPVFAEPESKVVVRRASGTRTEVKQMNSVEVEGGGGG